MPRHGLSSDNRLTVAFAAESATLSRLHQPPARRLLVRIGLSSNPAAAVATWRHRGGVGDGGIADWKLIAVGKAGITLSAIIDPATLDALCIGKGITPVSVTTIPAEPTAARMTLYHVTKSGLALLLDRLPQRAERARLRRQAEKIII